MRGAATRPFLREIKTAAALVLACAALAGGIPAEVTASDQRGSDAEAQPASGLRICNSAETAKNVAIGYRSEQGWVSEGWWPVAEGSCVAVLPGPLTARFYYVHVAQGGASVQGGPFAQGKGASATRSLRPVAGETGVSFCVEKTAFTIVGDTDCAARGHRAATFEKIDTAADRAAFDHVLVAEGTAPGAGGRVAPEGGQAGVEAFGVPELQPLTIEAVFQGCEPATRARTLRCAFVAGQTKYILFDDGRSKAEVLAGLSQIRSGRRVALSGKARELFGSTQDLILEAARLLPMERQDRILERLQGKWVADADESDVFVINGGERDSFYAGAQTRAEYISVSGTCGDFSEQGPYMQAWDSVTSVNTCYEIVRLSETRLELRYMPRRHNLTYRRMP